MQLCAYLYKYRCIDQGDKEAIEAMQYSKGRTAACREMFLAVKRRKDDWALLLLEAIKETQEYVKLKMDPSASQGKEIVFTNTSYMSSYFVLITCNMSPVRKLCFVKNMYYNSYGHILEG